MTRDEIIRMAREAGAHEHYVNQADEIPWSVEFSLTNLEAFAALVAAAEREACAKQVEPKGPRPCKCVSCDGLEFCGSIKVSAVEEWDSKTECAAAIRARSAKCKRAICQRGTDGYCAVCHAEMYPGY